MSLPPPTPSTLLPLQQAVLNAFYAACDLLPRNLRQSVTLIGGAATIAHGMVSRKTEDADILVSVTALAILDNAIDSRRGGFHKDSDETIRWAQRAPNVSPFCRVASSLCLA